MNKFKVTILYCDGKVKDVEVQGTDGPEFNGDNGMYKHLDCSTIEITGARYKDKNYDLYFDEVGRITDQPLNQTATEYFCDWLDHEGRTTFLPDIMGTAALVERNPISD